MFGAGTIRWPWGLDVNHDFDAATPNVTTTPDIRMQQATVNLFADMGVQPATLQSGLVAATQSTDVTRPASVITEPPSGSTVGLGQSVAISGTAADASGGLVAGVEVSVDGETTWQPAIGTASWTYNWVPAASGSVTIKSRAIDDSGNIESPGAGIQVTVSSSPPPQTCPCSLWNDATLPAVASASDTNAVELGVKFRADADGVITGLRFYKGAGNTGAHVGNLWTVSGTLLASVNFTNESASGWQQVNLPTPVAVTAGATYLASYHTTVGGYAFNSGYFASDFVKAPLRAPATGVVGGNGVYQYGASSFPTQTFNASNYWVDVVYDTNVTPPPPDTTPPTVTSALPADGATGVSTTTAVSAGFSEAMDQATISTTTVKLAAGSNPPVSATVTYTAATKTATLTPSSALGAGVLYTATVKGGPGGVKDVAGNALAHDFSWSFTTAATPPPPTCPCSLWNDATLPAVASASDTNAVELGVKFRADADGVITGLRFYKGAGNTGAHVGNLWTVSGTLLASVNFTNESASGWQQVNLPTPVAVTAGATYLASYHTTVGGYAFNSGYFASDFVKAPLRAPATGVVGGNGVYQYGASSFPTQTFNASNYWVDVVYDTNVTPPPPDTTPPTVTSALPADGATGVSTTTAVSAGFSEAMDQATISTTTVKLAAGSNPPVSATVTYTAATKTATLTPSSALGAGVLYTATVKGGPGGVKDVAGNALAHDFSWSFTTAATPPPPTCPCSLWNDATLPAVASASDTNAVELGVKFRADADGVITGLRFYKGAGNTGAHVGNLWTVSGTLLASVNFTNESASGWQQVNLPTPVAVTAGATYLASYHTTVGGYAFNSGYFASDFVKAPLRAPATGVVGGNGVYQYGASSFPTQTFNASNYWVDVVYDTNVTPPPP